MYYIKIPTVRFTDLVRSDPQGGIIHTLLYLYLYHIFLNILYISYVLQSAFLLL